MRVAGRRARRAGKSEQQQAGPLSGLSALLEGMSDVEHKFMVAMPGERSANSYWQKGFHGLRPGASKISGKISDKQAGSRLVDESGGLTVAKSRGFAVLMQGQGWKTV